jgi:hypothetical protein
VSAPRARLTEAQAARVAADAGLSGAAPSRGARTDTEVVEAIREELWPAGDPGSEWDDETVERVATLLRRAGRGPS